MNLVLGLAVSDCSELADEFLAAAVLVHLRHVPVPVVDVEPALFHLPLEPPQLDHLGMLGVPLPPVAVILRAAVVVVSPGPRVPAVVGAVVVVGGSVPVVGGLVTPSCPAASQCCSEEETFFSCKDSNSKSYRYRSEEYGLGEIGEKTKKY